MMLLEESSLCLLLWLSYAPLHEITSCSLVGPLAHFLSSTTRCKAHKIEWVREKGEEINKIVL